VIKQWWLFRSEHGGVTYSEEMPESGNIGWLEDTEEHVQQICWMIANMNIIEGF
jgi:hypothetical protein